MAQDKHAAGRAFGTVLLTVVVMLLLPVLIFELSFFGSASRSDDSHPVTWRGQYLVPVSDSRMAEKDSTSRLQAGDVAVVSPVSDGIFKKNEEVAYRNGDGRGQIGRIVKTVRPKKLDKKSKKMKEDKDADPTGYRVRGDAEDTDADDCYLARPNAVLGRYALAFPGKAHAMHFYASAGGLVVCGLLPILLILGAVFGILFLNRDGRAGTREELPKYRPEDFQFSDPEEEESLPELQYDEQRPIHLVQGRVLRGTDPEDPKKK